MKLFIWKTNIESNEKRQIVANFLNQYATVLKWSIDMEDIDHVLRIESMDREVEESLINKIQSLGFNCETLPD